MSQQLSIIWLDSSQRMESWKHHAAFYVLPMLYTVCLFCHLIWVTHLRTVCPSVEQNISKAYTLSLATPQLSVWIEYNAVTKLLYEPRLTIVFLYTATVLFPLGFCQWLCKTIAGFQTALTRTFDPVCSSREKAQELSTLRQGRDSVTFVRWQPRVGGTMSLSTTSFWKVCRQIFKICLCL